MYVYFLLVVEEGFKRLAIPSESARVNVLIFLFAGRVLVAFGVELFAVTLSDRQGLAELGFISRMETFFSFTSSGFSGIFSSILMIYS